MPLPLISAGGPGGMVSTEYVSVSTGQRHSLRFYVAPFATTPSGSAHDYVYTASGPVHPTEHGVIATVEALGAIWATYYTPDWVLTLIDVAYNNNGVLNSLTVVPTFQSIVGTASDTLPSGIVFKRVFKLRATGDGSRMFVLSQIPGTEVLLGVLTTPTSGGIDDRDRRMVDYLSGAHTAIVARSGNRFEPQAQVMSWWARPMNTPPTPPPTTGGAQDQFIGPTAPINPQDGWLWVQTGTPGPPWQLWVYDGASGHWEEVGTVTPPLPAGRTGNLLVNSGGIWQPLPDGALGHELVMGTNSDGNPFPTWEEGCCTMVVPQKVPPGKSTSGKWSGDQYMCGAAVALADQLAKIYNAIAEAVAALTSIAIGLAIAALFEILAAAFGFAVATAPAWIFNPAAWTIVSYIAQHVLNGFMPTVEPSQALYLVQDTFCCLPQGTTAATVTDAVKTTWSKMVGGDSRINPLLMRDILGFLITVPPDSYWTGFAAVGAQEGSTICGEISCMGGAMSGGALISQPLLKSMTGGAYYDITGNSSITGGAWLARSDRKSLTGGAQRA